MDMEFSDKKLLEEELKKYDFPQMMLTRNLRSQIGAGISSKTKGFYNHFCWLLHHDRVASQDWMFREVSLDNYLTDEYVVKFVIDTRWKQADRDDLFLNIRNDLNSFCLLRVYDLAAIFGQWSGMRWIHIPFLDICSDKAKYLRRYDENFSIDRPNPTDINNFQKKYKKTEYSGGYFVTAKWVPEDY